MKLINLFSICLLALFFSFQPQQSQAQSLNVIAGNTLFGAATGTGIGGATMLLTNNSDYRPLTLGLGIGTLAGVSIGVYDMLTMSQGMRVHGLFNSAPSSGAIIFLDTLYGSATGSLIGMAIALIGDTSVLKGFRYGIGIGAYGGLAFGLIDAFYFGAVGSQGEFFDYASAGTNKSGTSPGLISIYSNSSTSFSTLNPVVVNHSLTAPGGGFRSADTSFGLELFSFSRRF
ncbi:MAG: hypothetical protein LAT84_10510 [Balneolia bacterium]|nr:hypothetical protein [Balneolia bacterium]